jgi:hypothetical protein
MIVISIVLGLLLLFTGRKLFWLFVAAMGVVAGLYIATAFVPQQSQQITLLVALLGGVAGAILAALLQRLAVFLAGFVAGGYFLMALPGMFTQGPAQQEWLLFLIGGIIGAILVSALFDWALVILSSVAGATLIVQAFQFSSTINLLLFGVLLLFGIGVQARHKRRHR